MAIEIGFRNKESWCYSELGKLVHLLGEYAIAKNVYQEKAQATTKEIGDRKS